MDEIAAPGILAYKAGECFANLVSIVNEIPSGKDISSATLETLLQSYVYLSAFHHGPSLPRHVLLTQSIQAQGSAIASLMTAFITIPCRRKFIGAVASRGVVDWWAQFPYRTIKPFPRS